MKFFFLYFIINSFSFFLSDYFRLSLASENENPRKEPQLLPSSKSGCARSMMERISFSASFGCNGRSGVSTAAVPSNASFKALAIGQLPVAKNPCRNNIFFMLKSFGNYASVI